MSWWCMEAIWGGIVRAYDEATLFESLAQLGLDRWCTVGSLLLLLGRLMYTDPYHKSWVNASNRSSLETKEVR